MTETLNPGEVVLSVDPQYQLPPDHADDGVQWLNSTHQTTRQRVNELAWGFYYLHGYEQPERYDFSQATHPQEKLMFALAEYAYEFFMGDSPDYSDEEE